MGRLPCCDKSSVKKGAWTAEEDAKILAYVSTHGLGNWTSVPKKAGLKRCGKSCRLRYTNYLRPDLKRESFTPQEEDLIINLHETLGSRWSLIANYLPGRTDNDVKNYWNTKLKKKLSQKGIDPITHKPFSQIIESLGGYPVGLVDSHIRTNSTQSTITHVGCLNRDLKHAIMHSPTFMCKQESYLTTTDSSGYDLLAQLHAIKLVSDLSNPYNGNTFYPRATDTCSSSSSAISPPPLPPPQPSEELSWSDYLVDDVVMCVNETDKVVDDVAIVGDNISSKVSGGVGQSGALLVESVDVSGSEVAFVDSLLDQAGGMSWDLSGVFVEDGFDFGQSGGGF